MGRHREPKRLVLNVGSGLYRPLYREFRFDPRLAIDHNCGGDQRYNLQGRADKPRLWRLARHRIRVENLCFIDQVSVSNPGAKTRVAWRLGGAWNRFTDATVSIFLQQGASGADKWRDLTRVAKAIPCDSGSTVVDLSGHRGKRFRLIIRRDGDAETGGTSGVVSLD